MFIYDGPNTKARLYSRPFCNIKGPNNVESSSNTLYLEFRTDKENNDKGFEIEYKAKKSKLVQKLESFFLINFQHVDDSSRGVSPSVKKMIERSLRLFSDLRLILDS